MHLSNRWLSLATGALLATMIAGCGGDVSTSSGGGGSGGQTSSGGGGAGGVTSNGGSTATGGSGGAGQALADQGVVQADCAPNDGAAIGAWIGTASICNDSPNSAPQVRILAYPASMDTLSTGLAWDAGNGLSVWFYPDGTLSGEVIVNTAHLEVVNVTATDVRFSYSFTANGAKYEGTATLLICDSPALCG